jgi:hypothetical protein
MFRIDKLSAIAFSGSRNGCPETPLKQAIARIRPGAEVSVGCARGVDAQVRELVPHANVFRASDYPGKTVSVQLASRSAAMVEHIETLNGGLIAFPMKECPSMVEPCRAWKYAGGSGTWGTIALAVGLGVPTIIWLPPAIAPPRWDAINKMASSWYLCLPF